MATSSTSNQLKPCSICNGESCIMIPSLSNQQHFCLLHYYSTGQHRSAQSQSLTSSITKKKSTSLFVESQRMNKQLPNVQELFAEAFIDLQKEIGEESARSFQSASMSEDPLAALLDQTASSSAIPRASFRKQKSRNSLSSTKKKKKSTSSNDDMEGGFIRETQLPERLRKLRNPQTFASKYGASPPISKKQKQQSSTTIPNSNSTATAKSSKSNPYQRKQTKSSNVWNQILDNHPTTKEDNTNNKKKSKKMNFADLEREMISNITGGSTASTKTCTCGSTNVKIDGNVSNRNNDMMKGEVWGNKDRSETFERCHCLSCGRTWNDQD